MNKTLSELIKERNLDYVNKHITEENFPLQPIRGTEYKLFHFDRYMSSEEVISEIESEGYLPANIYELLNWGGCGGRDYVASLGSFAKVDLDRYVPGLWSVSDRHRLYLYWFDNDWLGNFRFLGIKPKESETEVRTDDISNTNEELLDNLVRDITKVGSISKSEARARIEAIIRDSQLTGSVETKDGNYAVINGKKYKLIEA